MKEPRIIDHDPDEPPLDRSMNPWPLLAIMVTVFGSIVWIGRGLDWPSVCLGGLAMLTFYGWTMEVTGNRIPKWLRDSIAGNPPAARAAHAEDHRRDTPSKSFRFGQFVGGLLRGSRYR